jgi:hypothetical protein
MVEEQAELLGLERPHRGPLAGVEADQPGHVHGDQVLALGIGQRASQRGPDPLLGRRTHRPTTVARPFGVDRGEHRLHVPPAQGRDLDAAKVRHQVVADVLPV